MSAIPNLAVSREDYFKLDDKSETGLEWHRGQLVNMEGATPYHSIIVANLLSLFKVALAGTGCRPYEQSVRIGEDSAESYFHPDLSVVCGGFEVSKFDKNTVVNPVLVVEVLSPSTANYDLTSKMRAYTKIPSLNTLIYVEQDEPLVTIYTRTDLGFLTNTIEGLEAVLAVQSLGVEIPFRLVYEDVLPRSELLTVSQPAAP